MATRVTGPIPGALEPAYRECIAAARSHYENFTVASRFMPKELLPHVSAIYAYCRGVDDLGDEAEGDRLALLDAWAADFETCYTGEPEKPRLRALQHTIREFDLEPEPFRNLIAANRIDQAQHRYETFEDVLDYCRHSASPVGRLYLALLGHRDAGRVALSDATCTALQLANFWQDVRRDYAMDRIYIPMEDLRHYGYSEDELAAGECTPAFRDLMAYQVARTRRYFEDGLPLANMLKGMPRLHVKLFSLGGMHVLDAIESQNYDVLTRRPTVTSTRKAWFLVTTWLGMKLTRQV